MPGKYNPEYHREYHLRKKVGLYPGKGKRPSAEIIQFDFFSDPKKLVKKSHAARSYQKRKAYINRKNAQYYIKNKEQNMLLSAKTRAKRAGLEFNLEREDIIIPQFCPIMGIELRRDNNKFQSNSPTLDRIDNNKGYIKGNIWVISALANTMKNKATKEELIKFSRAILNFYGEGS